MKLSASFFGVFVGCNPDWFEEIGKRQDDQLVESGLTSADAVFLMGISENAGTWQDLAHPNQFPSQCRFTCCPCIGKP